MLNITPITPITHIAITKGGEIGLAAEISPPLRADCEKRHAKEAGWRASWRTGVEGAVGHRSASQRNAQQPGIGCSVPLASPTRKEEKPDSQPKFFLLCVRIAKNVTQRRPGQRVSWGTGVRGAGHPDVPGCPAQRVYSAARFAITVSPGRAGS